MRFGRWVLGLGFLAGSAAGQRATAVTRLDGDRFLGQWFEIARLPNKAEKACMANSFSLWARAQKNGRFMEVNSCQRKPGDNQIRQKDGEQDKAGDGKLRIRRLLLLHKPQWVLAIDPDYNWALMGTPNHKELWVLSRSSSMTPETLANVKNMAAMQGFNTAKLVMVTQERGVERRPTARVLEAVSE